LALGLWTVAQKFASFPPGDPRRTLGDHAKELFDRMDFSSFYDPQSGLIGGNLQASKGWRLESPRYQFGSEARSLYTIGYALKLFRKFPDAPLTALRKVPAEFVDLPSKKPIMTVWDGGVFQALLPRTLANEELYSPGLRKNAALVASYLFGHGPIVGLPNGVQAILPLGATASISSVRIGEDGQPKVEYSGKGGVKELEQSTNHDPIDGSLLVPHATLLAASVSPDPGYTRTLQRLSGIQVGNNKFYLPGFGFTASLRLSDDHAHESVAAVNSAAVGVDKGIELVSLLQILDPDGLSPSGRAMRENTETAQRLSQAFAVVQERWRRTLRTQE
jgi:hypothetical protein